MPKTFYQKPLGVVFEPVPGGLFAPVKILLEFDVVTSVMLGRVIMLCKDARFIDIPILRHAHINRVMQRSLGEYLCIIHLVLL